MNVELKAKSGKTRVVGVDVFSHEDYVVGDYDTPQEALDTAEQRNQMRAGAMCDIYYVYTDSGQYLSCNLGSKGVSP